MVRACFAIISGWFWFNGSISYTWPETTPQFNKSGYRPIKGWSRLVMNFDEPVLGQTGPFNICKVKPTYLEEWLNRKKKESFKIRFHMNIFSFVSLFNDFSYLVGSLHLWIGFAGCEFSLLWQEKNGFSSPDGRHKINLLQH